jgi:hypothetical protein
MILVYLDGAAAPQLVYSSVHACNGRRIMTKFIVLTLSRETRDKNIYVNMNQVQYLRPIEETGNTQVIFDKEHWVLVNEGTEQILKLAGVV